MILNPILSKQKTKTKTQKNNEIFKIKIEEYKNLTEVIGTYIDHFCFVT